MSPRLSRYYIADQAYNLRIQCSNELGISPFDSCDIMEIYNQFIYPQYGIELNMDHDLGQENGKMVLGKTTKNKDNTITIWINSLLINDPRLIFTLAHELGHAILHLMKLNLKPTVLCSSRREYEADVFAEYFLMPDPLVIDAFENILNRKTIPYLGPSFYDLFNVRRVYITSLYDLATRIARPLTKYFFNVSKESMALKLVNTGLINNIAGEDFWTGTANNSMLIKNFLPKELTIFS